MISSLREFHQKYPHIKDDLSLIEHLSKAVVDVTAEGLERSLRSRSFYRIGDLIEKGECKVLNKQTSKFESEIQMAEFSYYFGPLTAGGGKIYLFGDTETVFLEVQEWIS